MMRPIILAALSSLALSACVLSVDWDGLAGSGPVPVDAGDDASDAMITADADAGDASDARVDASTCPAGGFCDDFERTDLIGPWGNAEMVTGGSLAITNHAYAGSGALRTTLGTAVGARAQLEKGFPSSTSLRVSYRLFETSSRTSGITPVSMDYGDRVEIIIVGFEGPNVRLYEQEFDHSGTETYFNKTVTGTRRLDEWVEVILEISLGTVGHAKLTYGGGVVTDTDLARQYGAKGFTANIGENYAAAGEMMSFDIDDVQVTWVPSH